MKPSQFIMLAIATLIGTASLTACGDAYYVEPSAPRPIIVRPTPAPIIVRPAPAPIIVRPAPEVIILRDRPSNRSRDYNRPPATRPSDLGTYDASTGKAPGSKKDTSGRSTSFQRRGDGKVEVLVPYVDKYGRTSDLREPHNVYTDRAGREYIKSNGTGEKQYLNNDGTVGERPRRHRRHR